VRKIYVYIISLIASIISPGLKAQDTISVEPPDTVTFPLAVNAAIDVSSPVIYFTNKNNLNLEGFFSVDLNEKKSVFAGGGFARYSYSQYNYAYSTGGIFVKAGLDFNFLKPQVSPGRYWAGLGLHYGASMFSYKMPEINHTNYWGTSTITVPSQSHMAHFLEASGGFRSQLFGSFRIGWSVSMRKLIYAGGSKDTRPIYIPGYGLSSKSFTTAFNYFFIWNFRYKSIKVFIKKEAPEEPEDTDMQQNNNGSGNSQEMQNVPNM
jgi:hypothetical protein